MQLQKPTGQGVTSFTDKLCESYFPYEIMRVDQRVAFLGRVDNIRVGHSTISKAYANTSFTGRSIPRHDNETIVLHWMMRGNLKFLQDRREVDIGDGDAILLRSDRPMLSSQNGEANAYALTLPAALVRSRYPGIDDCFMQPLSTQNGLGAMLKDGLTSFWKNGRALGDDAEMAAYLWLVDLVGASFQHFSNAVDQDKVSLHMRRVAQIVAEEFADASLTIDTVAARMQISRSYLFSIMSQSGQTFGRFLQEYRLKRAAEFITTSSGKPQFSQVAHAVGFKSVSHFSRSFTQHFGFCPRAYANQEYVSRCN